MADGGVSTHKVEIAGATFERWEPRHPDSPTERPYRFDPKLVRDVHVALKLGLNTLITGPTGCGKTSLPIALAAQLGRPVLRFNLHAETRVSAMVGTHKPISDGGVLSLRFHYGALVRGIREGYWIVLDEIDAATPGVLMVLQPVLEEDNRSLHIPETDETVRFHPRTHIFATGNTLGYRSPARVRHAGTNMMNTAFIDRFGMVIAADYPEREEEQERVRAHVPNLDPDFIEGICRVAHELRRDDKFKSDFSTRRLVQWARLMGEYVDDKGLPDPVYTFDLTVGRKMESATDRKVAREMLQKIFGYAS